MKLVFLIICLVIVLLTLENLIVSKFHTYGHRLLPLILGLFALYEFYLIVEYLTGDNAVFPILKDLLLIQLLDLILYYILDFLHVKVKLIQHIAVITVLILMDILIFTQINNPERYKNHVNVFLLISTIAIVVISIFASRKKIFSKQAKRNNVILFFSLIIPSICLFLSILGVVKENNIMPVAISITCILLDYLFFTDRLRDVDSILKEEHFQTLEMPAFLFDKDLFFIDASKKARELFSEHIEEIIKTPENFALQNDLKKLMGIGGIEYRKIGDFYYKITLQEAHYKGKMKGYILTFMDITEQKNEADIAKQIAREKSEFLANMSHDLRSPLHAIIGSSEIVLSRIEMSERTRVMVNHIHEAGNNLLEIVNSILDFSKLENNKLNFHPKKYNFKRLVETQSQIAFSNLKGKDVSFSVEIKDDYPEFLYGDEIRVRQIIQNLISNACKFTEEGSVKCIFRVNIENNNRVKITYSVEDTGLGMSAEQIAQIFNDYVSFAQENKREGTGLGLSIVKKIAEMMGGTAFAESDGKTGSTVTVCFYQELAESDISDMKENGIELEPPLYIYSEDQLGGASLWKNNDLPNFRYPTAKVLITDDMQVNRQIFKEITEPWGFICEEAENGLMAVEMVRNNNYDLIFLDQMMPVMSGLEAADEIKMLTATPKVLLTANITEAMKSESKKHGVEEFLQKPIDISVLKTILETYLPETKREIIEADSTLQMNSLNRYNGNMEKALGTYISELKELYKVLPEYKENDLSMFRNKVHGIKGASRQLGKENFALLAEIMEMAAITENKKFIDIYFDTFYKDLEYTINVGEKELSKINRTLDTEKKEVNGDELNNLIRALITALKDYDMSEIDEKIKLINEYSLEDNIKSEFEKLIEFYEDMEYEKALEIAEKLSMIL